ncbi:MAG: hypothetical protein Q4C61_11125 [Lachnospiraceae bacterium]|nr:hypothetical protein [Lachnospiraceae bacterium]
MKRMPVWTKNLLRCVFFFGIFLVMLVTVSYILRPYSGGASRKNLCGFYAEEEDSLDVVFIGSSAVFTYWEPMEFWKKYGVTSYDFAVGTMPPQTVKYCLKEIQKTQDPELYVIDLRTFNAAEDGYYLEKEVMNMDHEVPLRNVTDNVKYSLNRFQMIADCVPDTYDKLSYYLDIVKYHTEWLRLKDKQSLLFGRNETHDSLKGFKLVNAVKPVEFKDYSEVDSKRELSERLEGILYDLLDYCREEDLQVLFLVNNYCQSKKHKEMYNYMEGIITDYGFGFLNTNDFYQEIGVDFSTDYYDKSHVNIYGADKYTEFVGEYLMDHYSFVSKAGEPEYASWDKDYEVWLQETKELKESIQAKIDAAEKETENP